MIRDHLLGCRQTLPEEDEDYRKPYPLGLPKVMPEQDALFAKWAEMQRQTDEVAVFEEFDHTPVGMKRDFSTFDETGLMDHGAISALALSPGAQVRFDEAEAINRAYRELADSLCCAPVVTPSQGAVRLAEAAAGNNPLTALVRWAEGVPMGSNVEIGMKPVSACVGMGGGENTRRGWKLKPIEDDPRVEADAEWLAKYFTKK
jgi:hypothetical protein